MHDILLMVVNDLLSVCVLAVYANEEKNCFNVSGNNKKNKTVVDVTEHYLTVNR